MGQGFNTEVFKYDEAEWEVPIVDYQDDFLGSNTDRVTVCGFKERNAYVKEGHLRDGEVVSTALMAYTVLDEIGVNHPEISYDEEFDKLLIEEIPNSEPAYKVEAQPNEESFYRNLAARAILGDRDIYQNFLTYNSGIDQEFINIDFESSGYPVEDFLEETKEAIPLLAGKIGIEYEKDRLHSWINKFRDRIDIDNLESELRENPFVMESWQGCRFDMEPSIDIIIRNLEPDS